MTMCTRYNRLRPRSANELRLRAWSAEPPPSKPAPTLCPRSLGLSASIWTLHQQTRRSIVNESGRSKSRPSLVVEARGPRVSRTGERGRRTQTSIHLRLRRPTETIRLLHQLRSPVREERTAGRVLGRTRRHRPGRHPTAQQQQRWTLLRPPPLPPLRNL